LKSERANISPASDEQDGGLHGRRSWLGAAGMVAAAVCVAMLPPRVLAQSLFRITGNGQYQYNSNVFDVSGPAPVPGTNDFTHGDSYYAYGVGFDINAPRGWEDWFANGSATGFRYDHFSQLSHTEYKLDGGLRWHAGLHLNGTFEASRSKTMVPFLQIAQSQIATTTEQREAANATYLVSNRWSIDGSGALRNVDEPLVTAPQLRLRESQVGTTLKYLGRVGLTFGISGAYQHGDFTHTNGTLNPSYDQENASLVAEYSPPGKTSFDGAVGFSRRTSATTVDTASALTGHLSYNRRLTPKTSVELLFARNIYNYITNAGSEIDTSGTAAVTWQATYKIGVTAAYVWTYSKFPNQGYIVGSARNDHLQFTALNINYDVLRWLTVKPYANVLTRSSDLPHISFNSSVFGVQLIVKWQRGSGVKPAGAKP
jgi:hypothetical protein